ncbi:MAG TPA: insulinase family protein, partial [Spirochaetia bacterium]|nr:insulinase family protein [Spirochaetia bacterium]
MSNFTIISKTAVPEYKAVGVYLRHRSGCLLYHLLNEDTENLFAFAFRTPPANSRGAAHIIEHSVLSGSKRFPLKDPFVALMKGSVNTFLNAMTYPDKTIYPASSTVEKDYFNLMQVYGDACFFPLLREEIFHQEGRRYEVTPEGKLQLVGVVYNEMLGNYGDIDSIVGEWSYRSLFPDSPYRFDSGGEPESIPDLTYQEFKQFHESYYHPSNCLIFLYGNIPTERQLEFIETNFLSSFEPRETKLTIQNQPRWSAPRSMKVSAPASDSEEGAAKSSITVNWLTCEVTDPKAVLSMEILTEMLLGNAGAPLQKAVVESRIGEDLSPQSGLETDVKELVFTVGVRGTSPERRQDFERLLEEQIGQLVANGIP